MEIHLESQGCRFSRPALDNPESNVEFTSDADEVTCTPCRRIIKAKQIRSRSDLRHIEETAQSLQEGKLNCPFCGGVCESDCFSSETVMLSNGYAEVWADGTVTQSPC